jgi:hypothetical protein
MSSVAFFPAYPLLGEGLTTLLRDPLLALVVLSSVSGLVAAVLLHRWCLTRLDPMEARWTVAALVTYPCAFYLMGITYADGLFLAASLAAFIALEKDRPLAAGALAALATASRPLGLAVVIGLWLRAAELRHIESGHIESGHIEGGHLDGGHIEGGPTDLGAGGETDDRRPRPWWRDQGGLLLAPLGLVGYCTYLGVRFGRPFAFVQAQAGWRQEPGPATWAK